MKYLKNYENNMLDNILDKISKGGIDVLTPMEKKYLDKHYKGDDKLETDILNRRERIGSVFDYDPRTDSEFFDNLSDETGLNFDFSKYGDDMIENGRYNIIWDELDDEDIQDFEDKYKVDCKKYLNSEIVYKPWDELDDDEKKSFKEYIKNRY